MARKQTSGATTVVLGPWKGVRFNRDLQQSSPDTLFDAVNVMPSQQVTGFAVAPRIGYTQKTTQMGGVGARTGQGGCDVDSREFVFVGGKVYRWNAGTSAWDDVSPVGITISATNHVYATNFFGSLLVSDGANRPWIGTNLGSTPITGAYIDIDGAGSTWWATGPIAIKSAKPFFVVGRYIGADTAIVEGLTIVWGEEANAALGYRQSGYDNAWQISLNTQGTLNALAATNQALYYFRDNSIGAITGDVNADFKTTATTDAVSTDIGSHWPATVLVAENALWFLDYWGRPWRWPEGGQMQPIWEQTGIQANGLSLMPSSQQSTHGVYDPASRLVKFAITSTTRMVFDVSNGRYWGRHAISATAIPTDSTFPLTGALTISSACICVFSNTPLEVVLDSNGYAWVENNPTGNTYYDTPTSGAVGFLTRLDVGAVQAPSGFAFRGRTLALEVEGQNVQQFSPSLNYVSPHTSVAATLSPTMAYATNESGSGVNAQGRLEAGLGPNCQGRWVRLWSDLTTTTTSAYAFQWSRMLFTAALTPLAPNSR